MKPSTFYNGPIWNWFGLSYARYLVIPRSLLQGMPEEWQQRMTNLLDEMRDTYDYHQIEDNYCVKLRGNSGKFVSDPLGDYRHKPQLPYRQEALK